MRLEGLIYQPPQSQVNSFALSSESIPVHHLGNQSLIELHVRAHEYITIHLWV